MPNADVKFTHVRMVSPTLELVEHWTPRDGNAVYLTANGDWYGLPNGTPLITVCTGFR